MLSGRFGIMTTHAAEPTESLAAENASDAIRATLVEVMACPACLGGLVVSSEEVRCRICDRAWPRGLRGIPLFDDGHIDQQAAAGEEYQLGRAGVRGWLRRVSNPPTFGLDLATSRCLRRLGDELRRTSSIRPVLNVGSGAHLIDSMRQLGDDILERTIHLDVSEAFELIDLVADASRPWPLRSESIDAVVASAMMHYLPDPHVFAEQVQRVLAPGGWLFLTVPMLQPQMEEFDRSRWTVAGLDGLFGGLDIIESGPTAGPATVLGRILMEFMAVATSMPYPRLWGPARTLWGWMFWPIKHLDSILLAHPRSHALASAVYILARKQGGAR